MQNANEGFMKLNFMCYLKNSRRTGQYSQLCQVHTLILSPVGWMVLHVEIMAHSFAASWAWRLVCCPGIVECLPQDTI